MRILHASAHYLPSRAGITTVLRELGTRERAAGHEVSVATFLPWRQARERYGGSVPADELIEGIRVRRFRNLEGGGWARGPLARVSRRLLSRRLDRAWRPLPDLIHVAGVTGLSWAASRLALSRGIPMVISLYGEEFAALRDGDYSRRAASRLRGLLAAAAEVTASGRSLQRRAEALLGRSVPFIPNGVDPSRLEPAGREERGRLRARWEAAPSDLLVSSVTTLGGRKGGREALRAFAGALREMPDLRFVIVGGGPDLEGCRALARGLGIASRVLFAGYRPFEEVLALYRASDLYLQAPLWEEGVSQPALEAQAAGVPAVLGRCEAMEDSVLDGRTGFLVDTSDVEGMAARILLLARDPLLRERMGSEGRRWASETFSYDAIASRYLEVFVRVARHA